MNTFSVSRLALALAFGVTLTACSSTPPDQRPSDQTAPGTSSRPILSAKEAQNFDAQHYFASLTPGAAAWNPSPITLPAQPDFVVGPAGTQGVTHTTIQAAVDAAIIKRTNKRQYIAVMPGEYQGTVYVPAAPGGITLYGTGEKPIDVKIGLSLDGGMSPADWRHDVNPRGKYMPGKPAWYMYDSCQSKHIRFLLGTGVHHAEFGVIEHHCAATRNDIHIPFNIAVGHQRTRLTIRFQTVLHTAVGDKEGVLTTENVDVIDLHFVAISTQCHRRMVTRIYAIAQRVFDGQVLQLQAIVL